MTQAITADMPIEDVMALFGTAEFREWERQKAAKHGRWVITWYDHGEAKRLWLLNEVKDVQGVVSELEHEYGVELLQITDILHTHEAGKTYRTAGDFWRDHPAQRKE